MNVSTRGRMMRPVLVAGLALAAFGCTGTGGTTTTTTTTASTTTTSSTTTTTINPDCATYTPSGVVLSDPSAAAGDTITVSGNGVAGTVEILMAPVGPGTATGVLATAPISSGSFSTAVTIPNTVTSGSWNVVVRSTGCTATATAAITIT